MHKRHMKSAQWYTCTAGSMQARQGFSQTRTASGSEWQPPWGRPRWGSPRNVLCEEDGHGGAQRLPDEKHPVRRAQGRSLPVSQPCEQTQDVGLKAAHAGRSRAAPVTTVLRDHQPAAGPLAQLRQPGHPRQSVPRVPCKAGHLAM